VKTHILLLSWLCVFLAPSITQAQNATVVEQVVVYKEPDRFAGWPANSGIWSWGDEIVVGFSLGYHDDESQGGHPIDRDKPRTKRQARSLDGGKTWTIETPTFLDDQGNDRPAVDSPGGFDFTHPDFAMAFRMEGSSRGFSTFCYSNDRAKTWQGPFRLPKFNRKGIFARTDYIVNGKHDLMAFLTAAKDEGGEGWPFCTRTTDGGRTWTHVGWIGPQPGPGGYAIMPSTLRLKDGSLLSIIRRRGKFDDGNRWWLEAFLSPNDGQSWYMLDKPRLPNKGNPAHMIRLRDGRIALTYGWRDAPYGVRAMQSSDEGMNWSNEIVLRDDGQSWDLGYPRTVQRADGKCVTAYYFNDKSGKERYIAATIWDPGPATSQTAATGASTNQK
jgi:hypothetical protein